MHIELSLKQAQHKWHGTFKSYLIGVIASILLTAISFSLVVTKILPETILINTIVGLALIQAICQLLCFLHLGKEAKPRWETFMFLFMVFTLLIIVVGTLWVMHDLNHRTMNMFDMEVTHD